METDLVRLNKAITYLEMSESLKDEPQFEIYSHRGVALSHLDNLDEALTWYKRAEKLCADHPVLLFNPDCAVESVARRRKP